MEILPLLITVGGSFVIYRMTNYSLGTETNWTQKRSRFHKSYYYSDYNDPTEYLNLLKIPPESEEHKPWLYIRRVPGMSKRYEIDLGSGSYFPIDHRQWDELLRYRDNFHIRWETDAPGVGMKGTPMVADSTDHSQSIPQMKATPKFKGKDGADLGPQTHAQAALPQAWWKETGFQGVMG